MNQRLPRRQETKRLQKMESLLDPPVELWKDACEGAVVDNVMNIRNDSIVVSLFEQPEGAPSLS